MTKATKAANAGQLFVCKMSKAATRAANAGKLHHFS
jgi:hypothetical protein